MPEWVPTVAAILVALIANGAGFILLRSQRNKTNADAADVLTGSALKMVQRWEARVRVLEERVDVLEKRVKTLEEENEELTRGARRLEGQLDSMDIEPVWRLRNLTTGK